MSLFWIILVTLCSVFAGTGFCFYVLNQVREEPTTLWAVEHVLCPIVRILVLLIVVSQIYPAIDDNAGSTGFWRILIQQNQFSDLVNLLFFGGLLLGFLPLVNHPVFALPVQSMLTIALVFHWQYAATHAEISLFPSLWTLLKIFVYMLVAYFVTREISIHLSRLIDRRFHIEGSIRLVSDSIYLILQIPVMLVYCSYLRSQLT